MEKYLVGGAVRDFLLNLQIKEKDWVVTGSSPQEMLNIGYEQVGKDFPVFLHPKNHEEYALARTETKIGKGYTGFVCHTDPSVTIEEDLYRRDLTINAMAYDIYGNLLDPYDGQRDIKLRLLRHVSDAFREDPLRVLRVARFAARFKNMGFTVAPETMKLMHCMTNELNFLSPERIWMETKKALSTDNPQVYFQVLRRCGGLKILFPELDILFLLPDFSIGSVNNNSLGDHTMMKLYNISCLSDDLSIRFAILFFYLKINEINSFIQQSYNFCYIKQSKISFVEQLCNRLKVPCNFYKLAKLVSIFYKDFDDVTILSPEKIIKIFSAFDCWRNPYCIDKIIYINKSHLLSNNSDFNYLNIQEKFLRTAFSIAMKVKVQDVIQDGFIGLNISKELYKRRICSLKNWNKINVKF